MIPMQCTIGTNIMTLTPVTVACMAARLQWAMMSRRGIKRWLRAFTTGILAPPTLRSTRSIAPT
ncbi:MAG: hypothetical protein C4310_00710 [Chloroflexota bacterium]